MSEILIDIKDEKITIDKKYKHLHNIQLSDDDERLVFGWFSVIDVDDVPVVDRQGHIITEKALEKASYNYVLNARVGGEMHSNMGVARLVCSLVFTKELQKNLGINLGFVGWYGGFKVDDVEVWKKIKNGEYTSFSIGGRAQIEEEEYEDEDEA